MWRKGEMTEKLDEEMEEQSSGAGEDEVIAFVGHGVEFKGVITYDGTVRIDGRLEGEIHTEGGLVVGEDAVIAADVTAGTGVGRGKITGNVVAADKVRLLDAGAVSGSTRR